jgi:predicted ArsR family transcriptional regulator
MADVFGERRKKLLRHLLRNKAGATVDELTREIGVTRTAVRQHLAVLIRRGIVAASGVRPSRGRPNQLYVLTEAGKEEFPRHYAWFAELLVEAIADEHGVAGLRTRLGRIASGVVGQLVQRAPRPEDRRARIERLSGLMDELGYDARTAADVEGEPTIEADNCVFHDLARKHPEICQFDLALLSGYTGSNVELRECMARGGHVCRFRFAPRQAVDTRPPPP